MATGLSKCVPGLFALLLSGLVIAAYRFGTYTPGVTEPLGWLAWFDQGKSIMSTRALLAGDLDPALHWYPLGYSLLAVPFAALTRDHPFLPVNIVCLLACYVAGLALARRMGLGVFGASCALALGLVGDKVLLRDWAIPWNTAPAAALIWTLLACCARQMQGGRCALAVGACWAALAACRPTEAVVVLPAIAFAAWRCRVQATRWADVARCLAGGLTVTIPYGALHVAVYGWARPPYMIDSGALGFTAADFAWRAYVLLIDPTEWFADGAGMVQHFPWLPLGFAGVPLALRWGGPAILLALALSAHLLLYVCYVDLLPLGLWRYLNVHYFAWAMPGYALLGAMLLRDLATRRAWPWAAASLAATLLLSAARLAPAPVAAEQPAKMVDFAGPRASFDDVYFSRRSVADAVGRMRAISDLRIFPVAGGARLIGLRRDVFGTLAWPDGPPPTVDPQAPQARYGIAISLGWPAWARSTRPRLVKRD